jgi:hypothetical protein
MHAVTTAVSSEQNVFQLHLFTVHRPTTCLLVTELWKEMIHRPKQRPSEKKPAS